MSIVKTARTALGMSQSKFGVWLAEQVGRSEPFSVPRISEYENCRRDPNRTIRLECMRVVVDAWVSGFDAEELV
jgi:hypothetical protein